MDWITGMQKAIDYIEANLTEEIDYEKVAAESFSSSYHFQRVFSILCGYTLGEYIRLRRLSLAGVELANGKDKVIDIALKYGYDSPDSFAKAFQKFHGITPSQARADGSMLKSFSRLSIKISLEGGKTMNYRIEEKPRIILAGFKRHFSGTPAERYDQEHEFYMQTRFNQYALKGLTRDLETTYNIMTDFDDNGYNYYIAGILASFSFDELEKELGEDAKRFEKIILPARKYLVCETERTQYPVNLQDELRKQAVNEWLPSSGYELADAPEVAVVHWFYKKGDQTDKNSRYSRYIELWLPIEKK